MNLCVFILFWLWLTSSFAVQAGRPHSVKISRLNWSIIESRFQNEDLLFNSFVLFQQQKYLLLELSCAHPALSFSIILSFIVQLSTTALYFHLELFNQLSALQNLFSEKHVLFNEILSNWFVSVVIEYWKVIIGIFAAWMVLLVCWSSMSLTTVGILVIIVRASRWW